MRSGAPGQPGKEFPNARIAPGNAQDVTYQFRFALRENDPGYCYGIGTIEFSDVLLGP
jgi:hypothetical protein